MMGDEESSEGASSISPLSSPLSHLPPPISPTKILVAECGEAWGLHFSSFLFISGPPRTQEVRSSGWKGMRPQLQFPGAELELVVIFFFFFNNSGNPLVKDRLTLADHACAKFLLELLVVCMFITR